MAVSARSIVLSGVSGMQRLLDWALIGLILWALILFGLQFPHSAKLDGLTLIAWIHRYGDPVLGELGSWLDIAWPPSSPSGLPLGTAFATWMIKIGVDAVFLHGHRVLGKLVPAPRPFAAESAGSALPGLELVSVSADSEHAREELLKRYREIERALKAAKRKSCTLISIDIIGSTQMKVGERDTDIAATFQAYEEMLKKIFEQYGAWKQAWTPDGVMICFLQPDLAVGAGQRVLQSLKKFNEAENRLHTTFSVRCGINEGEVPIYEDSKLEKVADRVIDVAGHMQKQGSPNALWLSEEVYNLLVEKSGFRPTGHVVDGYKVYEWSVEPPQAPAEAAVSEATGGQSAGAP